MKLNYRNFDNPDLRSNPTVINEVMCGLILEKYINTTCELVVGDNPVENLPDIYSFDRKYGYEVTNCEAQPDFHHRDYLKKLSELDFDSDKIKNSKIDLSNYNDIFTTVENNKITSTRSCALFHKNDWMLDDYATCIDKKLKKLNNGNYRGCANISLIILSIARLSGLEDAKFLQKAFQTVYRNHNKNFNNLYFFTTHAIFNITNDSIQTICHFPNDEFGQIIETAKNILSISLI